MQHAIKSISVEEILQILDSGQLDDILGAIEGQEVEFKGAPYQLSTDAGKNELAKDVSALANAQGGIILIGFRTEKDLTTAIEYVDCCRPFEQSLFDLDQYRKTLREWICPSMSGLDIRCIEAPGAKIVAAIVVPRELAADRPYIVTKNVESDGRVKGTLIGFYERIHADVPSKSADHLRSLIKDGLRFIEIAHRLDSIEAFLGSAPVRLSESGPDEAIVLKRTKDALNAVDRVGEPNIIIVVRPTTQLKFPQLFRSRENSRIVQLLEDPPVMRRDGFSITPKDPFRPSEIVQGLCRRIVQKHSRLFEVWSDGTALAIGPADYDLLGWATRGWDQSPGNRKPGLTIRNFVLAEVLLNFCNLMAEMFKEAVPSPELLQFDVVLDNMTDSGVPCELASFPDKGQPWTWAGFRKANSDRISTSQVVRFRDFDPEVVAYQLFSGIYIGFGFDTDSVPYADSSTEQIRMTRASLIGE